MKILYLAALFLLLAACSKSDGGDWTTSEPLIPVSLAGIEAVNVDNAGELPEITNDRIPKEAYMIGIRWIFDDANPNGNQSITPSFGDKGYTPGDLATKFTKRIYAVDNFNARNPAGANISQYFKQIQYLPDGIDEGFVLLSAPDPGPHTFKVVYTSGSTVFEYTTDTVELY